MKNGFKKIAFMAIVAGCMMILMHISVYAKYDTVVGTHSYYGGGYAVTGQIPDISYSYEIYDASNGLPTSDAMFLMGASDGYIWIGGYSGVVRYDGSTFDRIDEPSYLTSSRAFFEDSRGRIWVGTNDNGVVVLDGADSMYFSYKEGLTSSSVRIFEEDDNGNIFIGTTAGLCYVDQTDTLRVLQDERITEERILKLDKDSDGRIYGQTSNGIVFAIDDCEITELYESIDLGLEKITTILVDPYDKGKVYYGTEGNVLYYGKFGDSINNLDRISLDPLSNVHWLNYDCNRVWVSSTSMIGYIDTDYTFKELTNVPFDSGIEMVTADYQGNLWVASSTLGVMKVVANNFIDITHAAGMFTGVTNAVALHNGDVYIGTETGLDIIGKDNVPIENELSVYIGDARVRSVTEDNDGNVWVSTYTHDLGLVCYKPDGEIISFTSYDGMPSNQIRCVTVGKDGSLLVGTNGGLAVIKDFEIVRTVGADAGIKNTVFLTVTETDEGAILAGTDGDGIYAIEDDDIKKIGRNNGLTSDVVMRIIKDEKRDISWIVTSNSIEYMKNGLVTQITSFPYNNNYDMYFDDNDNAWILSSYGVYVVNADDMEKDAISDYKIYTIANGLPYAITSNSFGYKDQYGNLYMAGRNGVTKVNINKYYSGDLEVLMDVKSIYCDNVKVEQDEEGVYQIPASDGRVQITASVMDYSMMNPDVRLYLEDGPDGGVITSRSKLSALEYTGLPYGNYKFHIQILSSGGGEVIQDEVFSIRKAPRLFELVVIRLILVILVASLAGFIVWQVMRLTVIRTQYEEIKKSKEEAESANTAKSRFLANISHEIRTPINTIMGMNEMIMREDPTNVPKGYFMSVMNYAFDIRNASESLLGLINDLLDISKIESGKMHLVEREYDTQELFRSIVSMIRIKATEKALSFDVVIDEILPKRMYGDAEKIKQVVLNLLTNAVKYTSVGGFSLNVSMEERNDKEAVIRISVKDTGMGIKKEDMDRLFTAYERLDEEQNSGIQGTGLGLDISRKFAELMGGNIFCDSIYGEGSEFIFILSQKIVDATPLGIFIEHDESKASGPYVPKFIAPDADVLVVDDNPMNLSVIKGLLKATKVFVTTSESGADAIDKVKDGDFDVVLLDHMMPGLDGIETLAKIREIKPDLPVYALTANSVSGEEFYKSKGFNGYLAKPVDIETLESTLMKHIAENKMEKSESVDQTEELTELPAEMLWIYEVGGITVQEGIKNSGGISSYLFGLDLFLDTIDENSRIINDAYEEGNIRLFTIKVHALKSSARIIGALGLAGLAEKMEEAGNNNDIVYIDGNKEKLMNEYVSFKEKLGRIKETTVTDASKEPVPEAELKDAYGALADLIPQMDYDSVEMILESIMKYSLPDKDAEFFKELSRLFKLFDWDGMEKLINATK